MPSTLPAPSRRQRPYFVRITQHGAVSWEPCLHLSSSVSRPDPRPNWQVSSRATRSSPSTVASRATSSSGACWPTRPTSSSTSAGAASTSASRCPRPRVGRSGAEVSSALFDRVQTCDNHCEFCFIHQLPKGLRKSLYVKDDDYRLSFLYGNYTTLTRFTELDLERVVTERLSPINVSIHATDPEVRARMLRNRRGATSLRWLRALLDAGIEVHGQVVVCPGVNDGDVLEDTLAGILDRFPELATACIVPLGVSRYSAEGSLRPHTQDEAAAVVDTVEDWQSVFLAAVGRRVAFAADEYYLLAGRPVPRRPRPTRASPSTRTAWAWPAPSRRSCSADPAATPSASGPASSPGSTAPPPRATAPSELVPQNRARPRCVQPVRQAPIGILTGEYGARVLEPLVAGLDRPDVRVVPVENRFFGGNIGVTGLLVGEDLAARAGRRARGPPLPAARRLPVQRPLPRRHRPRRPASPGRDRRHRRGLPAPGPERMTTATTPPSPRLPVVAVVGRPNVGKSTLVNRIVGRREAIVEEHPGVTRDRKEIEADWAGRDFLLVDTGGWLAGGDSLDAQVSRQAEKAIATADVILFVLDVTVGLTDEDDRVAEVLRRSGRPVIVVANKVDSATREADAWTFARLGLGDPIAVSALHGRQSGELLDAVVERLPALPDEPEPVARGRRPPRSPAWPSSGGPTSASRRCSTG